MNVPEILALADDIETGAMLKDGVGFNMKTFVSGNVEKYPDEGGHFCNSVACIAGTEYLRKGNKAPVWAKDPTAFMRASYSEVAGFNDTVSLVARDALGLDYWAADELFVPAVSIAWSDITPAVAARCLRVLAMTGKVDWHGAIHPSEEIEKLITPRRLKAKLKKVQADA